MKFCFENATRLESGAIGIFLRETDSVMCEIQTSCGSQIRHMNNQTSKLLYLMNFNKFNYVCFLSMFGFVF